MGAQQTPIPVSPLQQSYASLGPSLPFSPRTQPNLWPQEFLASPFVQDLQKQQPETLITVTLGLREDGTLLS
jgi:hypothetical protein